MLITASLGMPSNKPMKLVYWSSEAGNVGDDLNPWLWPRVFGTDFFQKCADDRFVGIGSILSSTGGLLARNRPNVIFGSGIRSPRFSLESRRYPMDIKFVRGPISSFVLGGCKWISDPAILAPLYTSNRPASSTDQKVGFIPHISTDEGFVKDLCQRFNMVLVSPNLKPQLFFDALFDCSRIITEAMHGAILADSFRLPWRGIRITTGYNEGLTSLVKWNDWMLSLGIERKAITRFPILYGLPQSLRKRHKRCAPINSSNLFHIIEQTLRRDKFFLSKDHCLSNAQSSILEEAHNLRSIRSLSQ